MKTTEETVENSTVKFTDVDNCTMATGYVREYPCSQETYTKVLSGRGP